MACLITLHALASFGPRCNTPYELPLVSSLARSHLLTPVPQSASRQTSSARVDCDEDIPALQRSCGCQRYVEEDDLVGVRRFSRQDLSVLDRKRAAEVTLFVEMWLQTIVCFVPPSLPRGGSGIMSFWYLAFMIVWGFNVEVVFWSSVIMAT